MVLTAQFRCPLPSGSGRRVQGFPLSKAEKRNSAPALVAAKLRALLASGEIAAAEVMASEQISVYPLDEAVAALYARCAAERGDYAAALARWTICRERFPDRPHIWRIGLANALLKGTRHQEAMNQFRLALEEKTNVRASLAGLATCAGYIAPTHAEAWWLQAFEATPDPPPIWAVMRAQAAADAGDSERAYFLLRDLFARTHTPPEAAYRLLSKLLIETGRRAEAATELDVGRLQKSPNVRSADRLRLRVWLHDRKSARAVFGEMALDAKSIADLTALLEAAFFVFDQYERWKAYLELRERAKALLPTGDPAVTALLLRLDLALRDYGSYSARLFCAKNLPPKWAATLAGVGRMISAAKFPDYDAPKIFGIGLSRTGTSSLARALQRLGFLCAHFENPLTNEVLREDDLFLFDAAVDTPISMRFETLYGMFPNARFVLTDRPFESWNRSLCAHFERWWGSTDFCTLRESIMRGSRSGHGEDVARVHAALYFSHEGPREAHAAFHTRVERFFADKPAHKLLRLNAFAGQGWPELCGFLGRFLPDEPYPWLNRRAD